MDVNIERVYKELRYGIKLNLFNRIEDKEKECKVIKKIKKMFKICNSIYNCIRCNIIFIM